MKNTLICWGLLLSAWVARAEAPNLNWTGFESFAEGTGEIAQRDNWFSFSAANDLADASQVRSHATPPWADGGVPDHFGTGANERYLDVVTRGGLLWRSLYPAASATETGDAYSLVSTVYLDTLVQLTPCRDLETPAVESGKDQFVLWLNATSEGVTNLCLRAGLLASDGSVEPATFVFTNATWTVGAWQRLTVELIGTLTGEATGAGGIGPVFRFHLDGKRLQAATQGIAVDLLARMRAEGSAWVADAEAGALFGSLRGGTPGRRASFTAVGFRGTGAVDDLAFTEVVPQFLAGMTSVDFTLALGAGVSAVAYTLGDGPVAVLTARATNLAVRVGTVLTLAEPVVADWYAIEPSTLGTFTIDAPKTHLVEASLIDSPIPGVDTDELRLWAGAHGFSLAAVQACDYLLESYLFNTETLLDASPRLTIAAIRSVGAAWELEIEAAADGAGLSLANLKGELRIKTASTLAALDAAPATRVDFTTDARGRAIVVVRGETSLFMKASVGLAGEGTK